LPFCGYHVGDYFAHWLDMQKRIPNPPRIFMVNWFRQNAAGKFIWPGFGDNMRVLKWIIDRVEGKKPAQETLIGLVPRKQDLDLTGLGLSDEDLDTVMKVDAKEWLVELESQAEWFEKVGERMPRTLALHRELLRERVSHWV
jgi:phosphoenolpyruvate carboxykinase (GTP)